MRRRSLHARKGGWDSHLMKALGCGPRLAGGVHPHHLWCRRPAVRLLLATCQPAPRSVACHGREAPCKGGRCRDERRWFYCRVACLPSLIALASFPCACAQIIMRSSVYEIAHCGVDVSRPRLFTCIIGTKGENAQFFCHVFKCESKDAVILSFT